MHKSITVRGLDNKEASQSSSIQTYVWDKFGKIENLLASEQEPIKVDVVITIVRPHPAHTVEIRIHSAKYHVIVERQNPELYKAIDEALDIAWDQLTKEKDERVDNERKEGLKHKIKDSLLK